MVKIHTICAKIQSQQSHICLKIQIVKIYLTPIQKEDTWSLISVIDEIVCAGWSWPVSFTACLQTLYPWVCVFLNSGLASSFDSKRDSWTFLSIKKIVMSPFWLSLEIGTITLQSNCNRLLSFESFSYFNECKMIFDHWYIWYNYDFASWLLTLMPNVFAMSDLSIESMLMNLDHNCL